MHDRGAQSFPVTIRDVKTYRRDEGCPDCLSGYSLHYQVAPLPYFAHPYSRVTTNPDEQVNPFREGLSSRPDAAALHRRHFRRHRRSHPSQTHPGPLQPRRRWRPAHRRSRWSGLPGARRQTNSSATNSRRRRANSPARRSRTSSGNSFAEPHLLPPSEFGDADGYKSARQAARRDRRRARHAAATASFISPSRRASSRASSKSSKRFGLNQSPAGRLGARDRREAVRHRPRHRARELNSVVNRTFHGNRHLPHRPFPGQGDRAEHHGAALCERAFSSRSGITATSTTSRSPPASRSASRAAGRITKAPARCATWCKTICCNSSASWRWSRRPTSPPTACATKK